MKRTISTASASTATSRCAPSPSTPATLTPGRPRSHGPDVYQVAVGPIHAGVIESGHFRFHVVGDRILHLDVRLFYKHRGLERAAVDVPLDDAIAYAARACGACAVTNRVAYAHAAEQPLGLRPSRRSRPCAHAAARAGAALEPPQRHRRDLRRRRARGRQPALRRPLRGSPPAQCALAGHRLLFDSVQSAAAGWNSTTPTCRALARVLAGSARRQPRCGAISSSTPPSRTG